MDEARAVVADFCEKNPYLLGALPMTWFGCGPFARMVVAGVIYELRLVITCVEIKQRRWRGPPEI